MRSQDASVGSRRSSCVGRNTRTREIRIHAGAGLLHSLFGSAIGVPVFSIVAVPRPGHVSPVLSTKHAKLAEMDPRNDGQLLWYDAIAVRGNLLGYVNADQVFFRMRR